MSKFISGFASDIDAMLSYREALGFSRNSYQPALQNFDRYAAVNYPEMKALTREIATGWINEFIEKPSSNIATKATAIRLLGRYLSAVGKTTYILPEGYVSQPAVFTPYLFTDDELARLFHAADRLPKMAAYPLSSKIPPVLFRLIYTCGLRPNEGRELLRENLNLKTGEIFITKTKRKKERIVVMSDDMLGLCKKYDAVRGVLEIDSEYFFPRHDGSAHTALQIERMFKKCWSRANHAVSPDKLPKVRVYDLRHRFASAVLNRWLDEKQNLYNKLPYLRAYMGHDNMSETAYYIHILPENIMKSASIDWEALEAMIPGTEEMVDLWQR